MSATDGGVLALDCALSDCSVALARPGRPLLVRRGASDSFAVAGVGAADKLLPLVAEVMAASGTAFSALAAVGVTRGPGSFSGLRAGLAAAQGFALALGCSLFAVTTLEAVAACLPARAFPAGDSERGEELCIMLPAGGESFYCQSFTCSRVFPGFRATGGIALLNVGEVASPSAWRRAVIAAPVRGEGEALRALLRRRAPLFEFVTPEAYRDAVCCAGGVARLAAFDGACRDGDCRPLYVRPHYASGKSERSAGGLAPARKA